jgi:hypothetical protein
MSILSQARGEDQSGTLCGTGTGALVAGSQIFDTIIYNSPCMSSYDHRIVPRNICSERAFGRTRSKYTSVSKNNTSHPYGSLSHWLCLCVSHRDLRQVFQSPILSHIGGGQAFTVKEVKVKSLASELAYSMGSVYVHFLGKMSIKWLAERIQRPSQLVWLVRRGVFLPLHNKQVHPIKSIVDLFM